MRILERKKNILELFTSLTENAKHSSSKFLNTTVRAPFVKPKKIMPADIFLERTEKRGFLTEFVHSVGFSKMTDS